MTKNFDTIVVGGGSAGAIVAGILAQKSDEKIILLEAGGTDRGPITQIPLGLTQAMHNPRYDWKLESAPHRHLANAVAKIPRGKVLGGSGSINSMLYIRGRKSDYDEWNLPGWDGETVWKVFDALEQHVVVSAQRSPNRLCQDFIQAGKRLQIREAQDFNQDQEGLGLYRVNMRRGKRWTGVDAFLRPALRARPNLQVQLNTSISKILIKGGRETGVELEGGETLTAARRVILCAGAIATPRLLMASGYEHPQLGQNLQDHPAMALVYKSRHRGVGLSWRNLPQILATPFAYAFARRGVLSSPTVEAGGFIKTQTHLAEPDVQFHFGPFNLSYFGHGYFADACVLKPKSRGQVTLDEIDLNLLSDPVDRATLEQGYARLQSIMREMNQGEDELVFPEDPQTAVRTHAATAYHPVGTAALGTVVNSKTFLVEGLENVAVVDASLFPTIPAGNTNNPTMMLAYRAAQEFL